jgi:aminoglycoside phosphotransferase (APT) family kinase protein
MDDFDPVELLLEAEIIDDDPVQVDVLTGGYLNQVFRLRGKEQGDDFDWVVKFFMPETELALFPNLPEDERKATYLASTIGRAPVPISWLETWDGPVLVYEYCEGEIWQDGVGEVGRLLRDLRTLDTDHYSFRDVPVRPADILAEGDAFLPKIHSEMRWHLAKARPKPIEIDAVSRSFLHTDIGPGNIIVAKDTGRLVVIDWQCPAVGDPVQDVIAFLSPAFQILYGRPPLTAQQEVEFFAAYDDAALQAHYALMLPFYDWRMAGYCATRQAKYAKARPEAAQRYARALDALLERLA